MPPLLQEIANQTGLPWYNNPGPFKSTKGSVIGIRDGFLVSIGISGDGMRQSIAAALRFRKTSDANALLEAVKQVPEVKTFSGGGAFKISGQTLVWSFSKPLVANAQKITEQLDSIIRVMGTRAEPFTLGKCEQENCSNDVSVITQINGNSNLICEACKINVAGKQEEKRRNYESGSTNVTQGLIYGTFGALSAAAASAFLLYLMTDEKGLVSVKLAMLLPFMIALAAAYMVKKGIGRITRISTLTAVAPTLLGVLLSNVLYYMLLFAHTQHVAISMQLADWILRHLWELKWYDYGKLVIAMETFSIFGSAHVLWEMRPKFPAAFLSIGSPVITRTGMAKVASIG